MKNEKNCRKTNEPDIRRKIVHITQISAKYLDCLSVYFNGSAIYRSFRDVRYRAVAYFRNSLGAKSRQKTLFTVNNAYSIATQIILNSIRILDIAIEIFNFIHSLIIRLLCG